MRVLFYTAVGIAAMIANPVDAVRVHEDMSSISEYIP